MAQREKAQSDAVRGFHHAPVIPKLRNPLAKRQVTELSINDPDEYWQGSFYRYTKHRHVIWHSAKFISQIALLYTVVLWGRTKIFSLRWGYHEAEISK